MAQSIAQPIDSSSASATERARRASAVAADGVVQEQPDAEVLMKASRRRFTAQYKHQILDLADRCTQPGEIGALLRREGLYSSHLSKWRTQREQGALAGLKPRKRGRKAGARSADAVRVEQLERDNEKLRAKLALRTPVLREACAPEPGQQLSGPAFSNAILTQSPLCQCT